jgi:hypothetical protein
MKLSMENTYTASMSSGPQLYSFRDSTFYYGAYHLLQFTEEDRGKQLKISVQTVKRPICWIELWSGTYDGKDWVRWTTERGQFAVTRSGDAPQPNPSITWEIEPGDYTVYFVASSLVRKASDEVIQYTIEVVG